MTTTEAHNARPNKHLYWRAPEVAAEARFSKPYWEVESVMDLVRNLYRGLKSRSDLGASWAPGSFQEAVIKTVVQRGYFPNDLLEYVSRKSLKRPVLIGGLLKRLKDLNISIFASQGWSSRGILSKVFVEEYDRLPGVFSSVFAHDIPESYTNDLVTKYTGYISSHCAVLRNVESIGIRVARQRMRRVINQEIVFTSVLHANGTLYINGEKQTGEGKKVLWCSKVSDTRLVYIESVFSHRFGERSTSRRAAPQRRLEKKNMEIIVLDKEEGGISYRRLQVHDDIFHHVTRYLDKTEAPPMAAIREGETVVFILELCPIHTITYDLNDTVSEDGEEVVKNGKMYTADEKYSLFADLEKNLPHTTMTFLPQCSTVNISNKHVLCGRLEVTSTSADRYACHPNRFLERFTPLQVSDSYSSSLQFFYEIVVKSGKCSLGGVSSAFHPCLVDESPGPPTLLKTTLHIDETFDHKYSAHQYVIGLEPGREGRKQTLLFWRGESKSVLVQVFDNSVILAMIRPGRTVRNFSMHANYIRCLQPSLLRTTPNSSMDMYGHRRENSNHGKAFNPSIALLNSNGNKNDFLVVMRSTEDIVKWNTYNYLVAEHVTFSKHGGYKVTKQESISQVKANGVDGESETTLTNGIVDARLLKKGEELYFLFYASLSEDQVLKENLMRADRRLRRIDSPARTRVYMQQVGGLMDGGQIEVALPFCHTTARSSDEKNWSPFYAPRGLKFIYTISPLVVYRATSSNNLSGTHVGYDNCKREESIDFPPAFLHALRQSNLSLRGGSGGVKYGKDFLFVGHAFQSNPDPGRKNIKPCFPDYIVGEAATLEETRNREYDGMYWIFFYVVGKDKLFTNYDGGELPGKWRIKKISACSQLPGRRSPYPKIAFPTGLAALPCKGFAVSFGEWDTSSVMTYVSGAFMEAILKPVEILDVQSYATDCALFESLLLDYS